MKNQSYLLFISIFLFASCTTYVYRGEVVHLDNSHSYVEAMGTNTAYKTNNPNYDVGDIVEIHVKNDKVKSSKSICKPKLEHCHSNNTGLHSKIHIRNFTGLSNHLTIEYDNQTCVLKEVKIGTQATFHSTYIPEDYNILDGEAYAVFVRDADDSYFELNNNRVIKHITRQHHTH